MGGVDHRQVGGKVRLPDNPRRGRVIDSRDCVENQQAVVACVGDDKAPIRREIGVADRATEIAAGGSGRRKGLVRIHAVERLLANHRHCRLEVTEIQPDEKLGL